MKKYVFAGASSRALHSFAKPLADKFNEFAFLAGVFDISKTRARLLSDACGGIPVYDDFDKMLSECKPDTVIVAPMDSIHHEYCIRSMEAGCDVIVEKPMTIDSQKVKLIMAAEKRTGKKVTVTFNCRFMPYVARIKEILKEGVIGDIFTIDFEWFLDKSHGADYFRRWHRYMINSGGLLVHKATHHFDIINWWLEEEPEELFAFGARRFYGDAGKYHGDRCLTCQYSKACEFFWDISLNEADKKFYLDAENEGNHYIRDRCVFAPDIDIFDAMSVNVKYSKGALLSYSLIAFSPYEGWKASINGSKGRIEAADFHSGSKASDPKRYINIFNSNNEITNIEMAHTQGAHGGGDDRLLKMLFQGGIPDPLGQMADSTAGANSVLIGAGANISINERRPLKIRDLIY